ISPASFETAADSPVGSGPYKYVSQNQDSATYERFDEYWDPDVAKAAKLIIQGIPDGTARLNALQSGQIDFALSDAALASDVERIVADPKFKALWTDTQAAAVMYLNIDRGSLK